MHTVHGDHTRMHTPHGDRTHIHAHHTETTHSSNTHHIHKRSRPTTAPVLRPPAWNALGPPAPQRLGSQAVVPSRRAVYAHSCEGRVGGHGPQGGKGAAGVTFLSHHSGCRCFRFPFSFWCVHLGCCKQRLSDSEMTPRAGSQGGPAPGRTPPPPAPPPAGPRVPGQRPPQGEQPGRELGGRRLSATGPLRTRSAGFVQEEVRDRRPSRGSSTSGEALGGRPRRCPPSPRRPRGVPAGARWASGLHSPLGRGLRPLVPASDWPRGPVAASSPGTADM